METLDAIYTRRAVKHFYPKHKIPEPVIKLILEAGLQAPSSFNIQHCRLVLVTDEEIRQQMRAAAWDQDQITDASVLVVITADTNAWARAPERYWRDTPQETQTMMVNLIESFYGTNEQLQRDEAVRSCGIMGQTIMLAATDLGIDSCPMIGFDADLLGQMICMPEDHVVGMIVALGKGDKPAWDKPGQLAYDDVVFENEIPSV